MSLSFPRALLGSEAKVIEEIGSVARYFSLHERLPESFLTDCITAEESLARFPLARVQFRGHADFAHVDHFRLYAFFDTFQQHGVIAPHWANSPKTIARLLDDLLHYPWGFMAILSDPAPVPVLHLDPIRQWTFFSMFVKHHPDFLLIRQLFEDPYFLPAKGGAFWNYNATHLFPLLLEAGVPECTLKSMNGFFGDNYVVELVKKYLNLNE